MADADVHLIDETVAALEEAGLARPDRTGPTQLLLSTATSRGTGTGDAVVTGDVYVDARDEVVHVTYYAVSFVPEERLGAVAELMNQIACSGVLFALGLDLEQRRVRLRNYADFADITTGRRPLLRDLILPVVNASAPWGQALDQVAFEEVDPATALAEAEQKITRY